jgi:glutaredoxin
MSWSKAIAVVAAALLAWQVVLKFNSNRSVNGGVSAADLVQLAAATRPGDIVMYSTTDCPYCAQARSWLRENRFSFTECDAQVDEYCARKLAELQADGVPLMVVRGTALEEGFDVDEFVAALR